MNLLRTIRNRTLKYLLQINVKDSMKFRTTFNVWINFTFFSIFFFSGLNLGILTWHFLKHDFKICPLPSRAESNKMGIAKYLMKRSYQYIEDPPNSYHVTKLDSINILIGIMTSQQNLKDRGLSILRTWGSICNKELANSTDGTDSGIMIRFFGEAQLDPSHEYCLDNKLSNDNNSYTNGVESEKCVIRAKSNCFVRLKDATNAREYPPMIKAFSMLKYMYRHYILKPKVHTKIDWFIRVDDDVHVKLKELKRFLYSLNPRNLYYIGQMGIGRKQDADTINLFKRDINTKKTRSEAQNFCMGGTGIIFSRGVLEKMGPYIDECLKNTVSIHDDVEISRCIHMQVGDLDCVLAYEAKNVFYNDYFPEKNTPPSPKAIFIHPLKTSLKMYQSHKDYLLKRLQNLRTALWQKSKIYGQSVSFHYGSKDEIPVYSLISKVGQVLHSPDIKNPHINLPYYWRNFFNSAINKSIEFVRANNDPKIKVNLPETRVYAEWQPFAIKKPYLNVKSFIAVNHVSPSYKSQINFHELKINYPLQEFVFEEKLGHSIEPSRKTINFILPFSIRYKTLNRFLDLYEKVCLSSKYDSDIQEFDTTLTIIEFLSPKIFLKLNNYSHHSRLINRINSINSLNIRKNQQRDVITLNLIRGQFSRALALEYGASQFDRDNLLLFLDVDMIFSIGFLKRVLAFTVQNVSVYYPVVYSQYKNNISKSFISSDTDYFNEGFWNIYGYGMVSLYKSDFDKTDGFSMDIVGWGKEDVDLYSKIITKSNLTIYRSAEPGLIHVYHKRSCPEILESAQYKMCMDSLASYQANKRTLGKIIIDNIKLS
ncbi:unnamed protein product [Gordionus sp. m RMFG-2023]